MSTLRHLSPGSLRGSLRASLSRAAALLGAVSLSAGLGVTQGTRISQERSTPVPTGIFAMPWEISFRQIREAMNDRMYEIEQVRRVLDRRDPTGAVNTWISIIERLRHGPATERGEPFDLQFVGVEGQTIPPSELPMRRAQFAEHARFLFYYQSFRVGNAAAAERNYSLRFLGFGIRLERPVYRVAVFSKVGPRSSWLLELDLESGYPLYRGEFDVSGTLVGEVEVTRYDSKLDSADLPDLPAKLPQRVGPERVLRSLGLPVKGVPKAGVLPPGYAFVSSRVAINPYSGVRKAVLTYSDGIDHLFVLVGHDTRASFGVGHVIGVYEDAAGMVQCLFVHNQVQYLIIGRSSDGFIRQVSRALYTQVVR